MAKLKSVVPWESCGASEQALLRLQHHGHDEVSIVVVNKDGYRLPAATLFVISAQGLLRVSSLSPALGFPLDGRGRMKLRC